MLLLKPAIVMEKALGSRRLAVTAVTTLCFLFILLPILDRTGKKKLGKRLALAVPFLALIAWLVLSALLSMGAPG